ncbi:MAG: cupin domain-containing protein [Ruminococcus sp.]|nr:cupin domain-containing protein [Ruminococcus sp.]MCM1382375.1 cupin domain-containing protein [Muribaculaceae bacterium]MCM1480372.1 cupin domain-containing protein [Muribaculaceae bacterium]
MANFKKATANGTERVELHDLLGLTGAEISVNFLPAGAGVPFVHTHKQNEEIYIILEGRGSITLDGEKVDIAANDFVRVSPPVKRQIAAAADSPVKYLCVQVKENSLETYTANDGVVLE